MTGDLSASNYIQPVKEVEEEEEEEEEEVAY